MKSPYMFLKYHKLRIFCVIPFFQPFWPCRHTVVGPGDLHAKSIRSHFTLREFSSKSDPSLRSLTPWAQEVLVPFWEKSVGAPSPKWWFYTGLVKLMKWASYHIIWAMSGYWDCNRLKPYDRLTACHLENTERKCHRDTNKKPYIPQVSHYCCVYPFSNSNLANEQEEERAALRCEGAQWILSVRLFWLLFVVKEQMLTWKWVCSC